MDKTMLNLMFAYKGSINSREFKAGVCILFAATLASFAAMSSYTLYTFVLSKIDVERDTMYAVTMLNMVTSAFSPALVPIEFILTYSAIVLAIKRMRAMEAPCGWCISSGILNYLFFASLMASLRYSTFRFSNNLGGFSDNPVNFDWLMYLLILIIIAGIVNLVVLGVRRDEQLPKLDLFGRTLDPQTYALQIGNLQVVSAVAGVIVGGLAVSAYLFDGLNEGSSNFFLGIFGLLVVAVMVCNIILMVRRMRDTAYSPVWIAVVLGIYSIVVGLIVLATFLWSPFVISIFPIVLHIMIAFQFVLFGLKSKQTGNALPC